MALLLTLGRTGVVGQYLDRWFGISLPFTTAGVVVAEAFVAMPFLVVTVEGLFGRPTEGWRRPLRRSAPRGCSPSGM